MAVTGAGGGIISVPLLVFALHLSVIEAAPIGLLAVMLAAGVGAATGLHSGIVRYRAAFLLASCGIIWTPVGVWLAQRLSNTLLTMMFAAVLIFVAIRMLRQAKREVGALDWHDDRSVPPCQINQMRGNIRWTAPCAHSIMLSGSVAGLLSGLLGVGGGFVIVPALLKFTDLEIHSIIATSLAAIALVSAGGFVIAAAHDLVNWQSAWPFAIGAATGMVMGRLVARRLAGPRLQQSFAVFALVIALGLLVKCANSGF